MFERVSREVADVPGDIVPSRGSIVPLLELYNVPDIAIIVRLEVDEQV